MRYRSLTLDEHRNNCTPAELRNEGRRCGYGTLRVGRHRMKLIHFSSEHTAPESFCRILNPTAARHELERHYLFGGAAAYR